MKTVNRSEAKNIIANVGSVSQVLIRDGRSWVCVLSEGLLFHPEGEKIASGNDEYNAEIAVNWITKYDYLFKVISSYHKSQAGVYEIE